MWFLLLNVIWVHIKEENVQGSFIGPQEFVVGYSKAPKQPHSSARHICHSQAITSAGCKPATICGAA